MRRQFIKTHKTVIIIMIVLASIVVSVGIFTPVVACGGIYGTCTFSTTSGSTTGPTTTSAYPPLLNVGYCNTNGANCVGVVDTTPYIASPSSGVSPGTLRVTVYTQQYTVSSAYVTYVCANNGITCTQNNLAFQLVITQTGCTTNTPQIGTISCGFTTSSFSVPSYSSSNSYANIAVTLSSSTGTYSILNYKIALA